MTDRTERPYAVNPDIVATDLDDELVLLDPATQKIFSLNATGRAIWQALPADRRTLTNHLVKRFKVSDAQAETDVQQLLTTLLLADLIREG